MDDFEWIQGEPPPPPPRKTQWALITEELRKRPGKWAKRTYASKDSATAVVAHLRKYHPDLEARAVGKDVFFRVPTETKGTK